jgi:hypothetical protein
MATALLKIYTLPANYSVISRLGRFGLGRARSAL